MSTHLRSDRVRAGVGLIAGSVVAALAAPAFAGSDVVFRIEARSDSGLDVYEVHADQMWIDDDGNLVWEYSGPSYNFGGGLGGFDEASIVVSTSRGGGQTVNLGFDVFAGSQNTAFSIQSGPQMAAFMTAIGMASAAVTVTDALGDGATLSPDGAGMYRAGYNGSMTFAELIGSSLSAGAFESNDTSDSIGSTPIGGAVTDIFAEWSFTLTSFDAASGTSTFTVIPAPGALALIGIGGLAATRRRR